MYASCLCSSCLFVMPLMFTCSMDMPVARGVLIGLCGVFWVLVRIFCYLLVWVLSVVLVWFRTCALAPAPACGLAAHTDVGSGFDSTSPAKGICSASHRTGKLGWHD